MKTIRILGGLFISLLVACFLCVVRGGFALLPFVVFAVAAFVALTAWYWLSRRESVSRIERVLRALPYQVGTRYALVLSMLIGLAVWSGAVIASGGFGGWIIMLLVWLISPAIVCPIAPRFPILFGILAAACVQFSLAVDGSRLYSSHRDIQWPHVFTYSDTSLIMWGIGAVISLF